MTEAIDFAWKMELRRREREEERAKKASEKTSSGGKKHSDSQKSSKPSGQRLLRTRTSIVQENAPEDGPTLLMNHQSSTEQVSAVDEWWNATLPKKSSKQDLFLWKKDDGFIPAEHEKLVKNYGGKAVPKGYRTLFDEPPPDSAPKQKVSKKFIRIDEDPNQDSEPTTAIEDGTHSLTDLPTFGEFISDYKEHERLQRGRTNEVVGTKRCRPRAAEDPAKALAWSSSVKLIPSRLKAPDVSTKCKAIAMLADATEEILEEELIELIEMGMLEGMMQLFEDATSQSNEEIKQYLQSTRQGNSQEMSRHLNLIPISVMRILRNATCLLLHNFNLQPRDGQNIRSSYDWLPKKHGSFIEIMLYYPGLMKAVVDSLSHEHHSVQNHAAHVLTNFATFSDEFKREFLDDELLMETLRVLLLSRSADVEVAAAALLWTLFCDDESKLKVLSHRSPEGDTFLPTIADLLLHGERETKEMMGRIVWRLSAQSQSRGEKMRVDSVESARKSLGDGTITNLIKQDLCRQPGILEGLAALLGEDELQGREIAAAALWSLTVERENKRFIVPYSNVINGLANLLQDGTASASSLEYAASALRNLATDPVVVDMLHAKHKKLVVLLLTRCDVLEWQKNIVSATSYV